MQAALFKDRTAIVTGGARGIGLACAARIAAGGGRVALWDRDIDRANQSAASLGKDTIAVQVDVTSEESVHQALAATEDQLSPPDILVASAGITGPNTTVVSYPVDAWKQVIDINLTGVFLCNRAVAGGMAMRGRGRIVNIASVAGMRSMPLHAYAPAKAAVIAMTECLAAEWGPAGVRVNAVSPGYTRTPALQAAIDKGERDVSALVRNAALGRLVEPDEIARAVAFLAGPEAAAITGVNLPVDCGWLVAGSWHTYGGLREA